MRVLLIQVDGRMPNLALMKLSAYHKEKGDEVGFGTHNPERVYISVIFTKNLAQAQGLVKWYPDAECFLGGPGTGMKTSLDVIDPLIDYLMPDYDLYEIDYSMGFTSRGCIRRCPFCIVPKLEGDIRRETPIDVFHHKEHAKVLLLDNNLLASEHWRDTLAYILDKKLAVNFSQGLDIRLLDKEKAEMLARVKAETGTSDRRMYHFAWDFMETEEDVLKGIVLLVNAGIQPDDLTFYVLTGFNTTHEQDLYRVQKLKSLGVNPYVMLYEGIKSDPFTLHLARWVNAKIHRTCEFANYSRLPARTRHEVLDLMATGRIPQ